MYYIETYKYMYASIQYTNMKFFKCDPLCNPLLMFG